MKPNELENKNIKITDEPFIKYDTWWPIDPHEIRYLVAHQPIPNTIIGGPPTHPKYDI